MKKKGGKKNFIVTLIILHEMYSPNPRKLRYSAVENLVVTMKRKLKVIWKGNSGSRAQSIWQNLVDTPCSSVLGLNEFRKTCQKHE